MKVTEEKVVCYHCGEDCVDEIIKEEEKSFCCQGCHMVYQLLDENDLTTFYQMNNKAGVQQKSRSSKEKLNYLDDEMIRNKLIDFSDGSITKISFYLPQIHCSSCIWLIEKLPQIHTGVKHARVHYMKKEVYINFAEEEISLKELVELLINIGYEPLINLEDLEEKKKKKKSSTQTKAFFVKLGIVGFCFGNIMLLSFPEYLGITDEDQSFVKMFGYLNLVLALPVFFYGANDYLRSAWAALKHRGVNVDVPISLGILALFLRSAYEILTETGAGYLDSLSALIFLLLIGKWFQQKTFDNISFERDYKSYFPIAVTVFKGTKEETIPISNLKEGDKLRIRNGELIPADAILRKGEAYIDYSFVTGESEPVHKKAGDLIYAGGKQTGGMIELEMIKGVSQSYLTRLWNDATFKKEQHEASLNNKTNVVGKYFTFVVLTIAFGAFAYWWTISPAMAVNTFTAVLIVACPCALALNAPFTLGNSLRILARYGLYIKDTDSIERMAEIDATVFDKTGTITASEEQAVKYHGIELSEEEKGSIYSLVKQSTHPISQQIGEYLKQYSQQKAVDSYQEISGNGIEGSINGQHIKLGKKSFVSPKEENKQLQFKTVSYISIDGEVKGYFSLEQELRDGMKEVIDAMADYGKVSLLSGDNEGEKKRLEMIFPGNSSLKFNQSPQDKMDQIKELQSEGAQVMMLGDGLNDAGALKQADVGIAVAENVHQFSPACDGILNAKQMPHFHQFVQYSKASMVVVYIGFIISFIYNIGGLIFAVQGELSPIVAAILMPLSSITVVVFGVLGSIWSARKFIRQ